MAVAGTTPKPLVARLNAETVAVLRQPEMERRLAAEGVDIVASTPEEFDRLISTETVRWARVIKQAGIKGEQP